MEMRELIGPQRSPCVSVGSRALNCEEGFCFALERKR